MRSTTVQPWVPGPVINGDERCWIQRRHGKKNRGNRARFFYGKSGDSRTESSIQGMRKRERTITQKESGILLAFPSGAWPPISANSMNQVLGSKENKEEGRPSLGD